MPISRNPQPRGWTSADAATPPPKGSHIDLIQQSHERCAALGLTRIERPDYSPLLRSDLNVAKERNQRLFTHAAPVMEMLFEQIVDTESMIVLTDAQGTILHAVGDNDFLDRAGKVALSAGVNWAEQSKGTNAIGTALFEERPTLVHADEHFMHANHFLTCSAAPIFDPRGNMLGVLDVSGDQRSYHQHTMGLVRMSARMIENQWLSDDYGNRLRLHFHSRAEFIGTLLEGIIVVGADGKILGANRSALDQLAMTGISLRGHTLTTLFGTTVAAVHDHFRMPLPVPMKLSLPNGLHFHVSARIDWSTRRVFGGLPEGFDDGGVVGDRHEADLHPGLGFQVGTQRRELTLQLGGCLVGNRRNAQHLLGLGRKGQAGGKGKGGNEGSTDAGTQERAPREGPVAAQTRGCRDLPLVPEAALVHRGREGLPRAPPGDGAPLRARPFVSSGRAPRSEVRARVP